MVARIKIFTGSGLLYEADTKKFISIVDYKVKANSSGEATKWGGTVTMMSEIPMDVEYSLELEQEEDGRNGRIKLESGKEKKLKGLVYREYVFTGLEPLV